MMNQKKIQNEEAVSPVVGVMLMLVVTIIIAAVVSGFAGGLAGTQQKAPAASFECRIANSGSWGTSMFDMLCKGTDVAIPTKDLKLVTMWTKKDGTVVKTTITGPSTVPNTNSGTGGASSYYQSPLGFGPGVNQTVYSGSYKSDQHFGNYTLMAGTRMHNSPYGYSMTYGGYGNDPSVRYQYTSGTGYTVGTTTDGMQAILGTDWYQLRSGDIVNVQLIHLPSQKVLYHEKVKVEEG
jgi:archaeal type IV pilus assembly protein PilA